MALTSNYALFAAFALSLINIGKGPPDVGSALALWGIATGAILFATRPHSTALKWTGYGLVLFAAAFGCAGILFSHSQFPSLALGVSILSMSLAIAVAWMGKRTSSWDLLLMIPALLTTFLSALGRAYQIEPDSIFGFYTSMGGIEMAILGLLSVHIALRPPLRWPISILSSSYSSLKLLRLFLVLFSSLPVVFGSLFLCSEQFGFLDLKTATVYLVFTSVVAFWLIIIRGAVWAHKLNRGRDLAVQRLEESWKSRETYFRKLVDDSPVILYMTNESGGCTFLSKKWEEYTGRPIVMDLGLRWLECIHPDDRVLLEPMVRTTSPAKFESYSREYRIRRWDGEYRWVISTGFPRFDDKRQFIGYLGNVIDVHDRKINEDILKKDKQTAEFSNQTKSQFLANMSHEIRTPLNAILGFADLCGDTACSEAERVDYLKRIRWNGDHLLKLIDDILDLAKMESGSPVTHKSQFSITRTMDEIIASLKALASLKGLRLELYQARDIPAVVYSDPHRIKQIVTNLVGNAIKFTSEGGVKVIVSAAGSNIVLEIADTGVGVPPGAHGNLFKPFSQADGSVTRKFGGSGLGLHLSKKLAQSIGGAVELESSQPGWGSVFSFTFPIGTEKERKVCAKAKRSVKPSFALPEKTQAQSLFGRKILVAEDSADSKDLIQLYFRSSGAQVILAENGFEALETAWRENPDLILMDVQMPGLDGLEATRQLRNGGFKRPIVALTAHALQDEVDRSFEAGCNYHLTKPVMKLDLLSLVSELLQNSSPADHHLHH